jgi:hypothetical protein
MARLDEIVLSLQRGIDRLIHRLRRGRMAEVTQRRFLIVQIDGLSRAVLEQALASGRMPFLKRLLLDKAYCLQPMSAGLPTSTPAFQMAAMYGVRPLDIPGFHYFDRERQCDIHFPRRGHAAMVEAKHTAGRHGILQGGSAYGCVFAGGAHNSFFTLATRTNPGGRGVLPALSPFLVFTWMCLACSVRTFFELMKALPQLASPAKRQESWRWFVIKVGISIWMRGFFTMAASRDLYSGVPAVYVNYLDYDEAGHAFGPYSRPALVTLTRIDRAIRQLWSALQRVPEHRYDLYILSDHGQTACKPYSDINGGQRFERWILDQWLTNSPQLAKRHSSAPRGLAHGTRSHRKGMPGFFQYFFKYVNEDYRFQNDPEAYEKNGLRVISAGSNAFLYCLDEKEPCDLDRLQERFPGLAEKLSQSPGVGLVLARSSSGPVVFCQGKRYCFPECGAGPFAGRADAPLVIQGITELMAMPSAGDLVIYGTGAPQGNVSFIHEHGSHAGSSADEMNTFIVRPAEMALAETITHPSQLYDYFIRYQVGFADDLTYSSEQSQSQASHHYAPKSKGVVSK